MRYRWRFFLMLRMVLIAIAILLGYSTHLHSLTFPGVSHAVDSVFGGASGVYKNGKRAVSFMRDVSSENYDAAFNRKWSNRSSRTDNSNKSYNTKGIKASSNGASITNKNIPITSRENFFSAGSTNNVVMSPDGTKVAYEHEGIIRVVSATGHGSSFSNTFGEKNAHILSLSFAGNSYIVYTTQDDEQNVHLMSVNIQNKNKKDITPVEEAKSIRISAYSETIATITYTGEQYLMHKVSVRGNGEPRQIRESDNQIYALFDHSANPIMWYDNISDGDNGMEADIVVRKNGKEETIDHITQNDHYLSVTPNQLYKLQKVQTNTVVLSVLNLHTNKENKTFLRDVYSISQCDAALDSDGTLAYLRIHRGGNVAFIPIKKQIAPCIHRLDRLFDGYTWERISSSSNNRRWLIRVYNSVTPDMYYVFDTDSMQLTTQTPLVKTIGRLRSENLYSSQFVSISNRQHLDGYFTKCYNYSVDSPLVVILRESEESLFKDQFYPLVQLLANRGYAVLSINQTCCSDENLAIRKTPLENQMIAAYNWIRNAHLPSKIKNRILTPRNGNILFLSLGSSPASLLRFFQTIQNNAGGLFLINPRFQQDDLDFIRDFSAEKPIVIVNDSAKGESMQDISWDNVIGSGSYITYEQLPLAVTLSVLIEKFANSIQDTDRHPNVDKTSTEGLTATIDNANLLVGNDENSEEDEDSDDNGRSNRKRNNRSRNNRNNDDDDDDDNFY